MRRPRYDVGRRPLVVFLCLALFVLLVFWGWPRPRAVLRAPVAVLPRRRILIVLQYAIQQWPLLREALEAWDHPLVFPCDRSRDGDEPLMVDVLFYPSRDPTGVLRREAMELAQRARWRQCFGEVLFRSCDLPEKDDKVGVWWLLLCVARGLTMHPVVWDWHCHHVLSHV